jgi:DNA-binding winged helix-turn-helix (wHTH) protein/Tol biopolymer transport system component
MAAGRVVRGVARPVGPSPASIANGGLKVLKVGWAIVELLMNLASTDRVRFGIFEFDRLNRLLYRDGVELALPPRAVGILACLIDRAGQVVSKQDLLDEVWKDANVTETSLAEAVSLLRQTLADDSQRPTFIQTLPRRGYRFVHPLTPPLDRTTSPTPFASEFGAAAGAAPSRASEASPSDAAQAAQAAQTAYTANPAYAPHATHAPHSGAPSSDASAWQSASPSTPAAGPTGLELPASADAPERVWPGWLPWIFVAGIGLALGIVLLVTSREPSRTVRPVTRFTLNLPADLTLATDTQSIALSPDGRRVAIVAARNGGAPRLFVREMDQIEPAVLPETDDAAAPFFSPDGQWVGFFAKGQLRKAPVAGGPVETLCPAPHPFGAAWSADGTIVFAASWTGGLQRVSDRGGEPVTLTTPDPALGEVRHAWPDLLPDGQGVLFAGLPGVDAPEAARVAVLSRDGRTIQTLFESATFPRFVPTGHLLFTRGDAVFAAPFDPAAVETLGAATPVLDTVRIASAPGAAQLALAHAGSLITITADTAEMPEWLRWSDDAAPLGWPFPARRLRSLAVNDAGTRVAASLGDGHRTDLWMADLPDAASPSTSGGAAAARLTLTGQNVLPHWTPDQRIVFSGRRDGPFNLFVKSPDDDAAATRLTNAPTNQFVTSAASAAGIVYVDVQPRTGADLWLLPGPGDESQMRDRGAAAAAGVAPSAAASTATSASTSGASAAASALMAESKEPAARAGSIASPLAARQATRAPRPLARSELDEVAGALSPDGRWLAYQVGEAGTWNVVLRAADREQDEPVRVATGDGNLTAWAADGRALFFSQRGRVYRLALTEAPAAPTGTPAPGHVPGPGPEHVPPRANGPPVPVDDGVRDPGHYAISRDGRVLVVSSRATRTGARLEMVLEWTRELNAKVPVLPPTPKPVR